MKSRHAPAGPSYAEAESALLLREGRKIVDALGKMFAPFCEVVLHDLTKPDHSIIAIACPLSGRQIGQSVTELGLARIEDPGFPDVVQNYPNSFPDGRPAKSTSIGLRNSDGACIAAICLNMDVSLFATMQRVLDQFTTTLPTPPVLENLRHRSIDDIRTTIESFAATHNRAPGDLSQSQRKEVVQQLQSAGLLQLRNAASRTAEVLGISRASVYHALKDD